MRSVALMARNKIKQKNQLTFIAFQVRFLLLLICLLYPYFKVVSELWSTLFFTCICCHTEIFWSSCACPSNPSSDFDLWNVSESEWGRGMLCSEIIWEYPSVRMCVKIDWMTVSKTREWEHGRETKKWFLTQSAFCANGVSGEV